MTWAQRLKRVFNIDVEICRECGGASKVVACIEEPPMMPRQRPGGPLLPPLLLLMADGPTTSPLATMEPMATNYRKGSILFRYCPFRTKSKSSIRN